MVTCFSRLSRNRGFGEQLGRGSQLSLVDRLSAPREEQGVCDPSRAGGGDFEPLSRLVSFLVSFLSNFPQAPEIPQVTLGLGDAYSRLGNETGAVTQYLAVIQAGDNGETRRAKRSARTVIGGIATAV